MSVFPAKMLSAVCDISMGQAPKGDSYNAMRSGYPLIAGAGDFGELTPAPKKYTDAPTKLSRPGDLILCIRATIGDRNWSDKEYCLGRGVAGLRAKDADLSQAYLWHWLDHVAPVLRTQGRGATFLQVSKGDIAALQIPLPPLDEQKRIAGILDAADALRAKRRKAVAQLDTLLQATFLDMFGDPVTNPKGWEAPALSEVTDEIYRYPTYFGIVYENEGVPEIRGELIGKGGKLDADPSKVRFIAQATSDKFPRTQLAAGDLVMSVRGTIGKLGIVPTELINANMTANLIRISPARSIIDPVFLLHVALSPYFLNQLSRASSSTTIKTIKALDQVTGKPHDAGSGR